MKADRWAEIKELYYAAIQRDSAERPAFLEQIAAHDQSLRNEVESLLIYDEKAEGFIRSTALEAVARTIAREHKRALVGKQFGSYRVISLLGLGGMGEVYLAEDPSLERKVALKFLSPELQRDEVARQRFLREARSAAALDHPFICHIHEVGDVDGINYISMEYVEGPTLLEELRKGPFPIERTLRLAAEIADALDRAHQSDIVHLDLKPSNVMLTPDGHVKVMDFGLAKKVTAPALEQAAPQPESTGEGLILGTVPYMSPEQLKGYPVDRRSDIFSFGVLCYEMLTGSHPFKKREAVETAAAILHDDPLPLDRHRQDIPAGLAAVVHKMLQKDPAHRYQSVRQVSADFAASSGDPAPTRPLPRPWMSIRSWALALAGILLVGWSAFRSIDLFVPGGDAQPAPVEITPLTFTGGVKNYPRMAPDGTKVAFEWDGPDRDNVDIFVKPIGEDTVLRITTHTSMDTIPEWSPDSERLAFLRLLPNAKNAIYSIPAKGGEEKKLTEVEGPPGQSGQVVFNFMSWSPDGRWIAYSEKPSFQAPARILLLNVETGQKQMLLNSSLKASAMGDLAPRFSPDGQQIAFVRGLSDVGNQDIRILDIGSGELRQVTFEQYEVCHTINWLPDGSGLIFTAGRVGAMRTYRLDLTPLGEPHPLTGLGSNEDQATMAAGRLVFVRHSSNSPMQIWQAPGRRALDRSAPAQELIRSPGNDSILAVSPDGTRLAFVSSRTEKNQIWLADRDGSNPRQLTSMETGATTPSWSPDGRWISFTASDQGANDVYAVEIETGRVRQITTNEANDKTASFSRDGRSLYFSSSRSGSPQIWKMPFQGGEARQITRGGGLFGLESHDGRFLYFVRSLFNTKIWRVPKDGGEEVEVLSKQLPVWGGWDLAGEGIYYREVRQIPESGSRYYGVHYLDLKTGRTTEVFGEPAVSGYMWLAVSPEEESIFFSKYQLSESDLVLVQPFH